MNLPSGRLVYNQMNQEAGRTEVSLLLYSQHLKLFNFKAQKAYFPSNCPLYNTSSSNTRNMKLLTWEDKIFGSLVSDQRINFRFNIKADRKGNTKDVVADLIFRVVLEIRFWILS